MESNPLLNDWHAPHELPPYGAIQPPHFAPALHEAMREHRREIDALAAQPQAADFDNTLAAFDRCGRRLSRIESVFHTLAASCTSPQLQAVQREMAAPLAAHDSAIYMHAALFARIEAVHERRDRLALNDEQRRLLERTHLAFVRAGARLQPAQRERLTQIAQQLAELSTRFAQNVLHDEADYRLPLRDDGECAGLPGYVLDAAQQAASERGLDGRVITLSRSLIVPFLTFSQRRDLREQAWRAWVGRGEHPGAHDSRGVARDILALRAELAALHGYASYADYALADTMAGSVGAVRGLLDEVWPRALRALDAEHRALQAVRDAEGESTDIEDWDWRYWAEKVRQQHYALDQNQIKAYFALPRIAQAAFDCAQRLFGLRFTARDDLPVYHPDVRPTRCMTRRGGWWPSSCRTTSRVPASAAAPG